MTSVKKKTENAISQLGEMGFDPSAAPAEAVAKLAALTTDSNQIAVARALGHITAPEAAAMLAKMEIGTSGELRREIRRALFRLRQHGIEAPSIAETSTTTPQPHRLSSELSGMMSVADADGSRIAWMLKPRTGGGIRRLWALVSDHDGMLAVTADSLSRKELRSDRADLEQRAGAPLVDADWRLVDFLMCEAYRNTAGERRARVGSFLSLRTEMVAEAPPVDFHHPVYEEFAAAVAIEPSPDLMKEPDIAAYKLPQEAIKPFAEQMKDLQQSTLVLNRMVQEERVNAVLERAIEQLLTGVAGSRLRRRMEDTAYYFARTGKRTQAGWAVAAAARLRDGVELKRVPFFQLFMRGQLGALLTQEQERQQEQPRLIMTPAELMRARAAAQGRAAGRGRLR